MTSIFRLAALITLALSCSVLEAQNTVPALNQAMPNQTVTLGGTAATIDLRSYFTVPGVSGTVVQFTTDLGRFNVETFSNDAPISVANFLSYVTDHSYNGTIIHRNAALNSSPPSTANGIVQGGGYIWNPTLDSVTRKSPIVLEYKLPNVRGTLALARQAAANTATSEWFFNTDDNTSVLGQSNGGGYAVFGRVLGTGMGVVDAIYALPLVNLGSAFTSLPVRNYISGSLTLGNLVLVSTVAVIPVYPAVGVTGLLSFTASSSNTAVATVAVNGSSLVVTPVAVGSTTILVTASDVNGNPAATTFTATVQAPPSYLSNLSVRAAMTVGKTLIVGFVVDGGAKPMLVRAAGPTLTTLPYGLTGVTDPFLTLYNTNSSNSPVQVAQNDNWDSSLATTFSSLGAFAFVSGSKDAALQQTVSGSHTANVTATDSGTILVEAYDAGPNDGRKLTNLSARFQVGTGDNILIAGFALAGTGTKQLLIRAVGPTLVNYGVTGVLTDPQLAVFDGNTSIANNNDWSPSLSSTFNTLGAFALNAASKDAAIVVTLQAGKSYTVQVSGVGGSTGEALVEIYAIP